MNTLAELNINRPPSTRTYIDGNAKVTVHSPHGLLDMTSEEKQAWWDSELAKGNPIILNIIDAHEKLHEAIAREQAERTRKSPE